MTKKQIEYVILTVILIGGCLYGINSFYVQKQWGAVTVLDQQIRQQQTLDSSLQQSAAKIKQFQDQKNRLQQSINTMDQQIPHSRDIPQLIDFFYQVTSQYQVTGDKLQLGINNSGSSDTTAAKTSYPSISVTITYTGQPDHILQLLSQLPAQLSRKITLDETTLQYQKNGTLSLTLKASIYFQSGSQMVFEQLPKEYPVDQNGYTNLTQLFKEQAPAAGQSSPGNN